MNALRKIGDLPLTEDGPKAEARATNCDARRRTDRRHPCERSVSRSVRHCSHIRPSSAGQQHTGRC